MPTSIWDDEVQQAFLQMRTPTTTRVQVGDRIVEIPRPFPSPEDWRDHWIYFLLVDRFNNPITPPRYAPWNDAHGKFQGGNFNGVRAQLDYLQQLGVGAIWLSPVLKNCQYNPYSYHGYGIQDFLSIDPRWASDPEAARANPSLVEAELCDLVDEAHARGIFVIFDIVLNHVGDVFEYADHGATARWRDYPYSVRWRDEQGNGRHDWPEAENASAHPDAGIWPRELRRNAFFRRQGEGDEVGGDFASLKELNTGIQTSTPAYGAHYPVRELLIRAHQYLIAKYDVDGFRIDTLKYIEPEFARTFANAIREFAFSIGKKEFFTFGEIYDDENKIARYIGRNAMETSDLIGVDAALDFPLFYKLPEMAKGRLAPSEVINMFEHRKEVQRGMISSQGEASKFFVTFLDNHDQHHRFHYEAPEEPGRYLDQLSLAAGCLFALQGIPCLYYGTEQGLTGAGNTLEAVREALWGKANAFDRDHAIYRALRQIAAIRAAQPVLRYGRQYFRPLSGDGFHFGVSTFPAGVLAFSRMLSDQEIVIVANTNPSYDWHGAVIVDYGINPPNTSFRILYSNKATPITPEPILEKAYEHIEVREVNGSMTRGPSRVLRVHLQPMEVQMMSRV